MCAWLQQRFSVKSKNNSDAMLVRTSTPSNLVFVTFYHSLLTFMVELTATNGCGGFTPACVCLCPHIYNKSSTKNPHSRLFSWVPQLQKTVRGLSHGLNLEG